MAKDIKVSNGKDEMVINETQLEDFESRGYKPITKQSIKPKIKEEKKTWRPITEKKV